MICVRLMGGLGNQLFQYAAGRALAHRLNTVLKLDLTFLEGSQDGAVPRKFLLDKMNIRAERALLSEIPHLDGNLSLLQRINELYRKYVNKCCSNVLLDLEHKTNEQFFSLPDNTYLVGYWQSEKYFSSIAELLKDELVPKDKPDAINKELASYMEATNSVSLHVRRRDYVNNSVTNALHGICPVEYYQECVRKISVLVESPEFFIFSDEPEWVTDNMKLDAPFTVVHQNCVETPVWDLWLMSRCRHNIIANSSFSWWAAWMNSYPGKIVFAPQKWFAAEGITTEIVPEGWLRV